MAEEIKNEQQAAATTRARSGKRSKKQVADGVAQPCIFEEHNRKYFRASR